MTDTRREGLVEALRDAEAVVRKHASEERRINSYQLGRVADRWELTADALADHAADLEALRPWLVEMAQFGLSHKSDDEALQRIARRLTHGGERDR